MTASRDGTGRLDQSRRQLRVITEAIAKLEAGARAQREPIAVIGVGCRFPGGADGPEAFWRLLREGVDAITEVPADRWDVDQYYDPDPEKPGKAYTRHGGFLSRVDAFDSWFFHISPAEAAQMDPQQRLLLEVSWEALEYAGQSATELRGSATGVFVGLGADDYSRLLMQAGDPARIDAHSCLGTARSIAAGRLAYALALQGPTMQVDTSCSSSLLTVHLACQSLRAGECELALAGGVNLMLAPEATIGLCRMRALSPDGRCKTFDARADGYARGEGCGMVVLKRLSRAIADGDNILAVIRGSAVNHDGPSSGLTVPNGRAQQALLRAALAQAKVEPAHVSYVEAHGTGTSLGDPIEVRALGAVFGEGREQALMIGSVKTNVGHLESAAGIASLIKVVLALRSREIPGSLHFAEPNPHIPWSEYPIVVPTAPTPWTPATGPRLAGVSSFGISGTNVHVVLEEAPASEPSPATDERPLHVLTLSARTEPALRQLAGRYADHFSQHAEAKLADVAFTANVGRAHLPHRFSVVGSFLAEVREELAALASGANKVPLAKPRRSRPARIAFLFTGQGSQYHGMGKQLYATQPAFRRTMELCDEILGPRLEKRLLEVLYGDSPGPAGGPLDETAYSQPALFALEYALARLWQSWGIEPDAVMGHSVGEYVAACVAGVFSLEDGLNLIAERARRMQALPKDGAMVAVLATEAQVEAARAAQGSEVVIAAYNAPGQCVLSGKRPAVDRAVAALQAVGASTHPLTVSHAFHSPLMEPMLEPFERAARQVQFNAPLLPLVSNVTGQMFNGRAPDAAYWREHTRAPVRFADGIKTLSEQEFDSFVEIGPTPILSRLGPRCQPEGRSLWLSSLVQGKGDWRALLESVSALYRNGVEVDWRGFDRDYPRRRLPLPTYPFERKRHWFEARNGPMHDKLSSDTQTFVVGVADTKRRDTILATLRQLLAQLLQTTVDDIDVAAPFLEMGADSIVIVNAVRVIEETYGLKLAIRLFFEELTTLEAVGAYIDRHLAPDTSPAETVQPAPAPAPPATVARPGLPALEDAMPPLIQGGAYDSADGGASPTTALERVALQQLQLMAQQLELLRGGGLPQPGQPARQWQPAPPSPHPQGQGVPTVPPNGTARVPSTVVTPLPPFRVAETSKQGLGALQQRHLEALTARYTQKTAGSKRLTQAARPVLADNRAVAGFRLSTKEMLYPIVGSWAQGSRVRDVDGNEYVDITMGFGVHLFGHNPPFLIEALEAQLARGIQLGPQAPQAGEIAQLICELTGVERVAFCNTGTEAVMTALRLARTRTGRVKVAQFAGSYHGHFDGTLGTAHTGNDPTKTTPMTPGVAPGMVADALVLEYGDPHALDLLRAHAHELAAVLVEPVQSRRPDLQPTDFLRQLRQLTEDAGIALIFDEMVTGFRIALGGAQAWFGVEADIVAYGKIVGGGMPIGVIGGKAAYLDAIDGGTWSYGDASYPRAEMTFMAGTFTKNPLTMAATLAILRELKAQGPALQERLNQRAAHFAQTLNAFFTEEEVPIRIVHFGSLFRFAFSGNLDLLFYHLLDKGVYVWEGRNCFLSTAHGDGDIAFLVRAVQESVRELKAAGFVPSTGSRAASLPPAGPTSSPSVATVSMPKQLEPPSNGPVSGAAVTELKRGGFWERGRPRPAARAQRTAGSSPAPDRQGRAAEFSLFYFGNYPAPFAPDKYELLFEGAKLADARGFSAVWLPERHFHSFGGLSPNPSVLCAALAPVTSRIQLRAGSVVLPLHHPIRVAEEWAVVDNLSRGRVGISFASGWHPDDFVLAPAAFGQHRELMFEGIETVRSLWRGAPLRARGGSGREFDVALFPRPMQPELPTWVTIVNNADTYRRAGEIGAGVLTNLMGQSVEDLASNVAVYREALVEHGHDPASAHVTVLVHTFLGADVQTAREKARRPFYNYIEATVGLFQNLVRRQGLEIDLDRLSPDDREHLLRTAYERYIETSALIGTRESCTAIVDRLTRIGVDEIAAFVDFGVDTASVLDSIEHLDALRTHCAARAGAASPALREEVEVRSVAEPAPAPPAEPAAAPALADATPADGEQVRAPLTEAQEHLWVLATLGGDASLTYNMAVSLKMKGRLNSDALRLSIQQIVDRHEALRTTFSSDGKWQRIAPVRRIDVDWHDLSAVDPQSREAEVAAWFAQKCGAPFDLVAGPLSQFHVLRLGAEEHVLLLCVHHIIIDGWSVAVIARELGQLYSSACRSEQCRLEAPLQFREYIVWQEKERATEHMAAHERYWLEQFSGPLPVLNLPTDRSRPPLITFRGSRRTTWIDADLRRELGALARAHGCTPYMALLAAFALLLHRLTEQKDLVVSVPLADRSLEGSHGLVGYCSNQLPIRSRVEGNPTFVRYLTEVRRQLLDAYEHQDFPYARLLNKLLTRRQSSVLSPLHAVIFNFNPPIAAPHMGDLEIEYFSEHINWVADELAVHLTEIDGRLTVDCDYNTTLFDAGTIDRMLEAYVTLLRGVVAEPGRAIAEMPLLTDARRRETLADWNDTAQAFPPGLVHELFEAQVLRTPEAVAAVFPREGGEDDLQLTYRELNDRAERVAERLRAEGAAADVLVGLCVDRSLELLVGLLGVLKSGAAYVPLDPSYPGERLAHMLADSKAPLVLVEAASRDPLPEHQATVLILDASDRAGDLSSSPKPARGVSPDDLAYVIYTSGSTGKPKGVAITHRALANFLRTMAQNPGLTDRDTLLAVTSPSFDIAALELLLPLTVGARVVIAPRDATADGPRLRDLLGRYGVTVMQGTPATWRLLLAAGLDHAPGLTVLVGGEALPWSLADRLVKISKVVHNLYGPTEATVWATLFEVPRGGAPADDGAGIVPIGRPIANTRIYVLDEHGQPVPVGVPGALYIGGVGLARGYLGLPEMTGERFVPNPFDDDAGSRLYRTGDLARHAADGTIEFLGRHDDQVKIRGFRVELGEIEAVLLQHADVREAVIVARDDGAGATCLVAYVVPRETGHGPPSDDLRRWLRIKLPGHMVPSAFVTLKALPLTPNGKVDRKALPAPATTLRHGTTLAPRDETERELQAMWEDVLGVRPVGVRDDFFELGGHSFLAVRLVAMIQQRFGKALPLSELFEDATIERAAAFLREDRLTLPTPASAGSPLVAIQPRGDREPFFCVHPAGGHVVCYLDLARRLGPERPFYALQFPEQNGNGHGSLGTVEEMAARYVQALRTVQPRGPYHIGGWSIGGVIAFEMAQQLTRQGFGVDLLALIDSFVPVDIGLADEPDDVVSFARVAGDLAGLFAASLPVPAEALRQLGEKDDLQRLMAAAKLLQIVPTNASTEEFRRTLGVFRRNLVAFSRYEPRPYAGSITLFTARQPGGRPAAPDAPARHGPYGRLLEVTQNAHNGWDAVAAGGIEAIEVAGDHYSIVREPVVRTVAEQLATRLAGTRA